MPDAHPETVATLHALLENIRLEVSQDEKLGEDPDSRFVTLLVLLPDVLAALRRWLDPGQIPEEPGYYLRLDAGGDLRVVRISPQHLHSTGWREGAVLFRWQKVDLP